MFPCLLVGDAAYYVDVYVELLTRDARVMVPLERKARE